LYKSNINFAPALAGLFFLTLAIRCGMVPYKPSCTGLITLPHWFTKFMTRVFWNECRPIREQPCLEDLFLSCYTNVFLILVAVYLLKWKKLVSSGWRYLLKIFRGLVVVVNIPRIVCP